MEEALRSIRVFAVAVLSLAAACTSTTNTPPPGDGSANDSSSGGDMATQTGSIVCYDAAGKVTATCPKTLDTVPCALGDANDCASPQLVELYADDGKNGKCIHLVIKNICQETVYSYLCVGNPSAQCWWSLTLPGLALDVSECGLPNDTISYVMTKSSGSLQLLHDKCGF